MVNPGEENSVRDILQNNRDAFDKPIADTTKNALDIASHYPYNPERHRLYVNGSRVFPQYGSVSQYNHATDVHELSPAAGETVVLETNERPRYVVQYEIAATWALSISQSLQSGDRVRFGLYTDQNGWFFEHNDTHSPNDVDLVIRRAGSEVVREAEALSRPLTDFTRPELYTNWYNVGRQLWKQTYTDSGVQINQDIGTTSVDGERGPQVGNLPLRYEVTAGSGTSNLTLDAGSMGFVVLGDVTATTREKTHRFTHTFSTTGSWVPIGAIRIDPDRYIVNTQLKNTDVVSFGGSSGTSVRVMPMAVDPSKTDAATWAAPAELSATNSVIQTASTVSTFPDSTGTVVSSASDPGGYQLGYGSWYSTGTGSKTAVASGSPTRKRALSDRDVCIFLGNSSAAADVTVEVVTAQEF